jgi:hypothetical protein
MKYNTDNIDTSKYAYLVLVKVKDEDWTETHIVYLQGDCLVSQFEELEPWDVLFSKDLRSPFFCEKLADSLFEEFKRGKSLVVHEYELDEKGFDDFKDSVLPFYKGVTNVQVN